MKLFLATTLLSLLAFTGTANSEIYKWVDENGTVHFSDSPYSADAKKFEINATGIKLHGDNSQDAKKDKSSVAQPTGKKITKNGPSTPAPTSAISSSDYKITSSVGKLRDNYIQISGRISKGPACNEMSVNASASNENGLRANVSTETRLTTSWGSTTFSGKTMVSGSSEDRSFWNVDSVTVKCLDSDTGAKTPESPYRFTSSVGKIGADVIRISGRVKGGTECNSLTVTAQASTDTGLSAKVRDIVRKPNSFGSVTYDGSVRVDGSAEDTGFWEVDSIKATCNDE